MSGKKIRVLVIDDSSLVRSVLTKGLGEDPGIEVVGAARDPYEGRDLLVKLRPDVLTLDVEMPRMDGVTFLRRFMAVLPTPTVILSSLTTRGSTLALQALEAGAIDVVAKPEAGVEHGLEAMMRDLIGRVKVASMSRVTAKAVAAEPVQANAAALAKTTDVVIGLGASTGGVAALGRILPVFPAGSPGIVVVQHMPAGFTRDFAQRLDGLCQMRVSEARDGDRVMSGHILVAPGGARHLEVRRSGGEYRVALVQSDPVNGHVPSVGVFFDSLARYVGTNAVGCLLTGMGNDGADALLRLRHAGGRTFAQDQETSAVWGMPAAAHHVGAAEQLLPLQDVAKVLLAASARALR